jgi:hypothetical protein
MVYNAMHDWVVFKVNKLAIVLHLENAHVVEF